MAEEVNVEFSYTITVPRDEVEIAIDDMYGLIQDLNKIDVELLTSVWEDK